MLARMDVHGDAILALLFQLSLLFFVADRLSYLLLIPLQKESEQKDLFLLNGSIKHGVVTMVDAETPFFLARLSVSVYRHFRSFSRG